MSGREVYLVMDEVRKVEEIEKRREVEYEDERELVLGKGSDNLVPKFQFMLMVFGIEIGVLQLRSSNLVPKFQFVLMVFGIKIGVL